MSIAATGQRSAGEREALEVAEEAREDQWQHPSFCEELFAGKFNFDLIYPFPEQSPEDKKIGDEKVAQVLDFLEKNHDPREVDRTGEIRPEVIEEVKKMGFFGMKISKEYGGMELSQTNYNRIVAAVAAYCPSLAVWLSAHQSIGVPQPLKMFGTKEQKEKYLPRLARGELSAFGLTEPEVGSDPARMKTTATKDENGDWILNGEKLWCTNGPVADFLVVMAMTPPKILPDGREKKQITAFIVETNSPGVETIHRCHFMGLKGIQNGWMKFTDVKVPKENVLWAEGRGLKLALVTLNTGRLTMPALCGAISKTSLQIARDWCHEREQWGARIGEHEATAARLLLTAGSTYSIEAVSKMTSGLVDRGGMDIRIEASMAKLFTTGLGWRVIDNVLQIRGGRGFETAESLEARGEKPHPVEQMMRDYRINMIIEGTSSIQRLFMSREALDRHLRLAGALLNPKTPMGEKLKALVRAGAFYTFWYPKLWLPVLWPFGAKYGGWEGRKLRFLARSSRKLARKIFHAMVLNGPKLEKKQLLLGSLVDIGVEIFVASCVLSRYLTRKKAGQLNAHEAHLVHKTVDTLCVRVKGAFGASKRVPGQIVPLSKKVMDGELDWLEDDVLKII